MNPLPISKETKQILVTIPADYDIDHAMARIERGLGWDNNIVIEEVK